MYQKTSWEKREELINEELRQFKDGVKIEIGWWF